jgi:hypothetical protein
MAFVAFVQRPWDDLIQLTILKGEIVSILTPTLRQAVCSGVVGRVVVQGGWHHTTPFWLGRCVPEKGTIMGTSHVPINND